MFITTLAWMYKPYPVKMWLPRPVKRVLMCS